MLINSVADLMFIISDEEILYCFTSVLESESNQSSFWIFGIFTMVM